LVLARALPVSPLLIVPPYRAACRHDGCTTNNVKPLYIIRRHSLCRLRFAVALLPEAGKIGGDEQQSCDARPDAGLYLV
jgi:hypothetical protein